MIHDRYWEDGEIIIHTSLDFVLLLLVKVDLKRRKYFSLQLCFSHPRPSGDLWTIRIVCSYFMPNSEHRISDCISHTLLEDVPTFDHVQFYQLLSPDGDFQ